MTIIHQTSGRWRLGLGLSLLTVCLWGILPLALKVTLQVLDVYTVTWFRFLVSFVLLAMYLGYKGQLPNQAQLRVSSGKLLAIATIFLAGNYILFLKGLALTSPANAEVIIQLAPILLSLGGLILFRERYTLQQWMGVSVFTCGFIFFFHGKLSNLITSPNQYIWGSILVIFGAISWSIYALAQKQLLQYLSSAHIMMIIYGGCTLIFTPFVSLNLLFDLNLWRWSILIFCALNTLIAYGAFAESLAHWEASRVSAILALAPIVTLISIDLVSMIVPNIIPPEKLTFFGILGALLVVSGSVAIALCKASKN